MQRLAGGGYLVASPSLAAVPDDHLAVVSLDLVQYPVVLPVPESEDVLVLSDCMAAEPGVGNLARVRPDGTEVWHTGPEPLSQDAWTVSRIEDDECRASTWSGWDVSLDLATGPQRSRTFTK